MADGNTSAPSMIVQDGPAKGQSVVIPANVAPVAAPTQDMLDPDSYAVNVYGVMEAITQPLYSYVAYPAAGSVQPLQFFNFVPGGAVTQEDTNMQLPSQLPAPQSFLVQGIGVDYLPGTASARFGAQSALGQLPDLYAILRRGVLTLTIGSKNYLVEGPLMHLPPRAHVNGVAAVADATTAGAALQTFVSVGFSDGPVFNPRPLLIPPSQNFGVSLAWPAGAVAIPSADAAARIGVQLYGTLYRPAQ